MTVLWLIIYLTVAVAMQWAFRNIDVRLFAFPVGAAVGAALVAILYVAENEWGNRKWVKALRSPAMACWTIALTAVGCMAGGLLTADSEFQTSIPFVALLIALMANLTLTLLHRMRTFRMRRDWTFMAIHLGLWLALFSGLAGAGDNRQLNVLVGSEEEEAMAYDRNYRRASLSHTFKLQDFDIATNAADGSPTQYSARILIDNNPVDIAVNSPHALSLCEDIYLMNFKSTQEDGKVNLCVLTIERQPWKYPMLIGLVMLLIGTAARGGKIERLKD